MTVACRCCEAPEVEVPDDARVRSDRLGKHVRMFQCPECGCGAWLRVDVEKKVVTHWAEDVFKDQDEAERAWPLAPWVII